MDERFMCLAIAEARKASARGEIPVGAVLVDNDGVVLAMDGNRSMELSNPAGHAEMLVLTTAGRLIGNYRLCGTVLYVTVEPCPMCAGALVLARVAKVVFGARDPKGGGMVSQYTIGRDGRLNHCFDVVEGVMAEQCATLLRTFFRKRRGRVGRSGT